MSKKIAVIPGDGIGIDVSREAVKVLDTLIDLNKLPLDYQEFDFGAEKYLATGIGLPKENLEDFRDNYDAVFLGALGDPRVPDMAHGREILLGMRFKLDLYVNYRPVILFDERLCPLKEKTAKDINIAAFRENTEGLYVGVGGHFKKGTKDEIALQESVNSYKGVERIIDHAFQFAQQHGRRKVTMSDKNNAMRFEGDLWMRVFDEVASRYPTIEAEHLFVDVLSMQLVRAPERFDVIVTCNMFGDIVTDLGASLAGGLGLAASANINPGKVSLFEPVHGSAPKYAGKNTANPFAAILTLGLLLEYIGFQEAANDITQVIGDAVRAVDCTKDLGGTLGTAEAGTAICNRLRQLH